MDDLATVTGSYERVAVDTCHKVVGSGGEWRKGDTGGLFFLSRTWGGFLIFGSFAGA